MNKSVYSESPQGSPTSLAHGILAAPTTIPPTPPGDAQGTRNEAQPATLAIYPESVLGTSASFATLEGAEDTAAFPAFQNLRAVPQNRTQPMDSKPERKRAPKRTQTTFTVLDLDHQAQGESFAGTTLLAPVEEGYKPYGEERRKEGTEIFLQFETDTLKLFQTLLVFHNSIRSLGSTFTLLKAADVLRTDLLMLLTLFRNSASVHLKGLSQSESRLTSIRNALSKRQEQEGRWTQKKYISPKITSIPEGLDRLAYALGQFLARLNEVSEFAEENMNLVVDRCIQEISYRASTLRDFEGRMSETDVALYANDVAGLLGDELAAVEAAVKIFIEDGVANISRYQDRTGVAFQNLSTVSTLLSAVTATGIQFTYNDNGSRLASRTNMLWIISLSFSIASAIHSQLAYYWIRHSHRTPNLKLSTFGSLLIVRAPFAFFAVSTVAFSGGLIAFAFLVFNSSTIRKVAVICTSITIGTMMLVVLWIASEKSELLWLKVKDSAKNAKKRFSRWNPFGVRRSRPAPPSRHASVLTQRDLESLFPGNADAEGKPRPAELLNGQSPLASINVAGSARSPLASAVAVFTTSSIPILNLVERTLPQIVPAPQSPLTATLSPLQSFKEARPGNNLPLASEPLRLGDIKLALQQRKLGRCAFKLQPFDSAVRRITFSPDGRFLASCAWEPNVEVWKLDLHQSTNPILLCHCPQSSSVDDVIWCPDPTQPRFLVLCGKVVTLWQVKDSTLTQANSIKLADSVHRVAWMSDGNRFVAANGSEIHMMDVNDQTLALSSGPPVGIKTECGMSLIEIAIPTQEMAWVIADIKTTAEGRIPLSAPERRLLEIELSSGEVKDQLPFIHPVNDIVASFDGKSVHGVLTFSNKASSLLIKKKTGSGLKIVRPFSTTSRLDTAGRTSMGSLCYGALNQVVVGADRGGTVYFWDRKTATRLHEMNTEHEAPGLAHAAWNHASSDCLMLATATDDGHICLWCAPLPIADRSRT